MKRQRNTFLTPLVVEVMPDGKTFELHHEFTYTSKLIWPSKITVPVGFVTDFASIPRIFRWLIEKLGKQNKAAVVHDYLYQRGMINRETADKIFLEGMADLGVVKWKRTAMYWAVRVGGHWAWRR